MLDKDKFKRDAARSAVQEIESGMVIGLGTGSTSYYALEAIAELIENNSLRNIVGIATSTKTAETARRLGLTLSNFETHPFIDMTIDGADEVEAGGNLIKGGGGALLREKIVAEASRRLVIIVDESKLSQKLGIHRPVPIEVVPFGQQPVKAYLESLGARVEVRAVAGKEFTTDQGNRILDAYFEPIEDPHELGAKLSRRAGVVEHGLFLDIADEIIVAGPSGIRKRNN